MPNELTPDENALLLQRLAAIGEAAHHGGGLGARLAGRLLRPDIFETSVTLPRPVGEAVGQVGRILAGLGIPVPMTSHGGRTLRAMIGAGALNLNPAVVTVSLTGAGWEATVARIRGVAKEGLIRQHAGRKAAERVARALRTA
ncbi:hypothetical protein GCM10010168_06470 [Actinoplanes ianthinogenes]|uniref:Uncharacterized protein n=1 Tax=Actinoplanes ianthinogenes TaxID=122358 RepID=A0ABM7LTJ2_9ACTN|nr:hypothetical protein [Actinoplanes ianthinogenes]BCJ42611.1 hypothetical protein Aiant_32680 [Actinoplanes ianthinogenes]GGQ93459.1 hypothetical protein GCM10010168_06470 [Actinoplanes ianthinogenes]